MFHMRTNYLSEKRTLSSNTCKSSSSCRMRVLLNNKREKRRITKIKRVVMLTKQMKQTKDKNNNGSDIY